MNEKWLKSWLVGTGMVLLATAYGYAATVNEFVYEVPADNFTVSYGEGGDVEGTSDGGWKDDAPYVYYCNNMELWTPDDMRASQAGVEGWVVLAFEAPPGQVFETISLVSRAYRSTTDRSHTISFWYGHSFDGLADPKVENFTMLTHANTDSGKLTRRGAAGSAESPIGGRTLYVATKIKRPAGSRHGDAQVLSESFTFTFIQAPEE